MISTLIIESNRYLRESWQSIIELDDELCILGAFATLQDMIASQEVYKADIVIMKVNHSGINEVRKINQILPDADIILLATTDDNDLAFRALQAGAVGTISKNISPKMLKGTLKKINAGGSPITPYIARKISDMFRNHPPKSENNLSQEERLILRKFLDGSSFASIAEKMFSSSEEIQQRVRQIYKKLQKHPDSQKLGYS